MNLTCKRKLSHGQIELAALEFGELAEGKILKDGAWLLGFQGQLVRCQSYCRGPNKCPGRPLPH